MKKFFFVIVSIFTLSLFGCLTSDDSTSEEIKSSSSDATLSSSSEETKNSSGEEVKFSSSDAILSSSSEEIKQCKKIRVDFDSAHTFSWIQENGEGKRDTIFDSTSLTLDYLICSDFVGNERISSPLYGYDPNLAVDGCGFIGPMIAIYIDSIEVCPGDSLYNREMIRITYEDTVYLNYTENAIYDEKSIVPSVKIANKEEILATFDTIFYGGGVQSIAPMLDRFKQDNVYWDLEVLTEMEAPIIKKSEIRYYYCSGSNSWETQKCADEYQNSSLRVVVMTDSVPETDGKTVEWRLIAKNNLGFADTLEITSRIEAAPIVAEPEKKTLILE